MHGRGWGHEQESDVPQERDTRPAGAQQGADLGLPRQDGQRPAGRGQGIGQPTAGATRVLLSNRRIGSTLSGGVKLDDKLSATAAIVTAGHSAAMHQEKSVQQQITAARAAMRLMECSAVQQDDSSGSPDPAANSSNSSLIDTRSSEQNQFQQSAGRPAEHALASTAVDTSQDSIGGTAATAEGSSSPQDGEQLFTQMLWAADMHLRRRRPRAAEPVDSTAGPAEQTEQQEAVPPAWLKAPEAKRVLHVVTKAITPTTLGDLCALFGVSELQPIRDTLAVLWQCIEEAKRQRPELSGAAACLLGSIELLDADILSAAAAPVSVQQQQGMSSSSSVSQDGKGHNNSNGSTASTFGTPLSMGLALTVKPTAGSSRTGSSNGSSSGAGSGGGSGFSDAVSAAGVPGNSYCDSGSVSDAGACTGCPPAPVDTPEEESEDELALPLQQESPRPDLTAGSAAAPGPYMAAANKQHAVVRIVPMAALYAKLRSGVITTPVTLHVNSGCNFSAISLQFFKQHRHHLLGPGSNATLYWLHSAATVGMFAGPSSTMARYLISGVELDIGKGTYKQDFLVIEGANFEAVLGHDFLFGYAGRVWTRDVTNKDSGRYLVLPLFDSQCQPGVSPPTPPPGASPHWYPSQRVPLHYHVVEEAWPATIVTHLQV